jgi:tight adherence protein C
VVVLFLLGLLLTATAVALAARAAAFSRSRAVETIDSIAFYGFSVPEVAAGTSQPSWLHQTLNDIATLLGETFAGRLGTLKETELRKELLAAGLYTMSPRRFLGYQMMAAVAIPLLWVWLGLSSGIEPLVVTLGFFIAGATGWILPTYVLHKRAAARRNRIDYDIPELIDLLVVTVEAGLGFVASLRLASERIAGPLGEELRLTVQEQTMGLSATEALKNFVTRAETPATRSFVRSVTQGERLGVSMGQIMRNLALEMRKRRKAAAEERAQKAPIKILFPLAFLIFPALFIVILYPAFHSIFNTLGD